MKSRFSHSRSSHSRPGYISSKTLFLLAALLGVQLLISAQAAVVGENGGPVFDMGWVGTRALVLDSNGNPILAEYDEQGDFVKLVTEAAYSEDLRYIGAEDYRAILDTYTSYRDEHDDDVSAGALLLTPDEYRSRFPEGPEPYSATRSLLVRNPERVPYSLLERDPILLEAPIDLRPGSRGQPVNEDARSVLLDKDGKVLYASANRIGLRSAFHEPKDGGIGDPERDDQIRRRWGEGVRGPIEGVKIEGGWNSFYATSTDEDGEFVMHSYIPPCPGFEYTYNYPLYAKVPYSSFNPQAAKPALTMAFRSVPVSHTCIGYAALLRSSGNLIGLMMAINIQSIVASTAIPLISVSIPVDVALVQARGMLSDEHGATIPIGDETTYDSTSPEAAAPRAPEHLDLDGDDQQDWVGAPDGTSANKSKVYPEGHERAGQVMVVLGGQPVCFIESIPYLDCDTDEDGEPKHSPMAFVYRHADIVPDEENHGLLTAISSADLAKTDLYVFRTATGQLILKREGLKERDIDRDNNRFGLDLYIPGGAGAFANRAYTSRGLEGWQSDLGLQDEFIGRANKIDSLRPGEAITLVALNRPTGYLGIAQGTLGAGDIGTNGTDMLAARFEDVKLTPPNLRITAKRTRQDDEEFQIGFEGAALTDDTLIQITSEWFGPNGEVIPNDVDGYTGRLAKISAANTLSPERIAGNDVGTFNIAPGVHQQVLKFKGDITGPEHFYVHVSGASEYNPADFSSGAQSGILKYRPGKYVPLRVALYDEAETRKTRWERSQAGQDPNDIKPLYHWPYRPEMQFSAYALDKAELQEINAEDEAGAIIDLRDDDEETILNLLETVALDFFYEIGVPQFDPLQLYGPDRQLVFSLGGYEVVAQMGGDGQVRFDNLDFISSLSPEDLLTIQLLQDSDSGNILWEVPVEFLSVDTRLVGYEYQTEETIFVTADAPNLPLKAVLVGYAAREPEDKTPLKLQWQLDGPGTFAPAEGIDSDIGVFDTELAMEPIKGNRASIRARLLDAESGALLTEADFKTVEVVAGKPAEINISSDGEAVAMEAGELRVAAFVTDQHGNFVEDGTPVHIEVTGDSIVKTYSAATKDGWAEIKITGNAFAEHEAKLRLTSGDVVKELPFDVRGLQVDFVGGSTSIAQQGSEIVQVRVTTPSGAPVTDTVVSLSSTRGLFDSNQIVTDDTGIATVTFHAGSSAGQGTWTARAGYAGGARQDFTVTNPGGGWDVNVDDAMVTGDAAADGAVTYQRYDGANIALAYKTTGTIALSGDANAQLDVTLGDLADPNLEPLAAYYMNGLEFAQDESVSVTPHAPDELGLRNAAVENITVVQDNPMGAGNSYRLQGDSRITVAADPALNPAKVGFRLDIKPEQTSGTLLEHGNGAQTVELLNGRIRYTVRTSEGTHSLESAPLAVNTWHTVAGRFQNGSLELYVNGETHTAAAPGSLQYGVGPLVLGRGFHGNLNSFRLYNWDAQPLLNIGGGVQQAVQLDENGEAALTVSSNGVMGQAQTGSKLGILRVAVSVDGARQYVSVISRAAFAEVASYYVDSFYADAPPIAWHNIDPASPSFMYAGRSALEPFVNFVIPPANAFDLFGVDVWGIVKEGVSWIIPYEDIAMLGEQLYYLATADWENFNAVDLAFGALGTATIIPLAKPLKPFLRPLKAFMKKFGNKPIVKAVAGALGRAVEEAYKSRKLDKLQKMLPWLLIVAEIAMAPEGPEAIELMVDAIVSTDDLLAWIEYFSLPAEGWLSDGPPPPVELSAADYLQGNSPQTMLARLGQGAVNALIPEANAAGSITVRRIVGRAMAVTLAKVRTNIARANLDPKELSKIFKEAAESLSYAQLKSLRKYATKADFINACIIIYRQGLNRLRYFIRGDKDTRLKPTLMMAAVVFLQEAMLDGRIPNDNDQHLKIYGLIAGAFAGAENERAVISRHGAGFHLVMVAYYQLLKDIGNGAAIKDIETERPVSYYSGEREVGEPYKRRVDIVLASPGAEGETWVEVKSKRIPFKSSDFKNSNRRNGVHREFFADWMANQSIRPHIDGEMSRNALVKWRFAKFKTGTGQTGPNSDSDLDKPRRWLCQMPQKTGDFYTDNFGKSASALEQECQSKSKNMIKTNNTTTMLKDLFLPNGVLAELKDLIPEDEL